MDKIILPDTKYHKIVKWLCISIQAGVFLYLVSIWNQLPDKVPMHYNGAGEADSYGARWTIWITPVSMILMYQFLCFVERHPHWWNTSVTITKNNRDKIYLLMKHMIVSLKLVIIFIFGYISVAGVCEEKLGSWFLPVSLLITFGTIVVFGIILSKTAKKYQ